MKTGRMIAATMVFAVLAVAASNAALVEPSISDLDGALVTGNGFSATENNGLTSLTDPMFGVTVSNTSQNRDGGYFNTNGVSIVNAQGEYTLQTYVGNNGIRTFDWNSESRIGFFLDGAITTNSAAADLTTAIDAFLTDADVTITGGSVPAPTTPAEDTWELYTYTFTVADNGGSIFGSDLQFAARWDVDGGGNFFIDNIPEPATIGLVAAMGGGLLLVRRRLMM